MGLTVRHVIEKYEELIRSIGFLSLSDDSLSGANSGRYRPSKSAGPTGLSHCLGARKLLLTPPETDGQWGIHPISTAFLARSLATSTPFLP